MAFVNEKIPDADKAKIASEVSFEKIRIVAKWIPEYREPILWTVDRERRVYLIFLTGGGREQLPYYVLGIEGNTVVFNVDNKSKGDDAQGITGLYIVRDLRIPLALENRRTEINNLISEALKEDAFCRPFSDGGTYANPNMAARGNILSFNVEFK